MTKTILKAIIMIFLSLGIVSIMPIFSLGIFNTGIIAILMVFIASILYMLFRTTLLDFFNAFVFQVIDKVIITGIVLFLLTIVVVSFIMAFGVERSDGVNVSVVVVPGAKIHGDYPSRMLKQRLDAAVELLNDNPKAICVVSGGQGLDEQFTEAYVMKKYLMSVNIDESRILMEDKSVNTQQNFMYTAEILKQRGINKKVTITTDFYHSYRCNLYAKRANLTATAYPCKTQDLLIPSYWIREVFAVIKAYFVN